MPPNIQRRPVPRHGGGVFAPPARLTKLYTDTKRSSLTASPAVSANDDPEVRSLDRKLRIQKDRLIAWGLEWTDEAGNGQGDIDKSVERAGLTEVVSSVMENIKGILEEVERLKRRGQASGTDFSEKSISVSSPTRRDQWTASEKEQYNDFVRDLTSANDLLCELSRGRREPESGKKRASDYPEESSNEKDIVPWPELHDNQRQPTDYLTSAFANEGDFSPASLYPALQTAQVPKVNINMLLLPEEGPPPYHASGNIPLVPSGLSYSPRAFGHLRRSSSFGNSASARTDAPLDPIMIEYVPFDKIYKNSDIPLPLNRLEQLYSLLDHADGSFANVLPKMIAYFEDPQQARYGLVFTIPSSWSEECQQSPQHIFTAEPISLFALLQNASKLQSNPTGTSSSPNVPALEDRFHLAREVVTAFSYLQECSYTHRNVSSSSIALPPKMGEFTQANADSLYNVRKPIICSFDLFSEYDVDSSPEFLHQNIYRHPDDPSVMGPNAASNYDVRFDMYSLGLVLLEIGMWHPLADLFKEKYSLKDFRMRVERIWIKRLASRCGTAYMRCVQDCFNAGSRNSADRQTLAKVYTAVRNRLERCCSIEVDEEEDIDFPQGQSTTEVSTPAQSTEKPSLTAEKSFVTEPEVLTPQESHDPSDKPEKRTPRYQFPSLELPAEVLWQWNNTIEDRLARVVQRALGSSKESCCIYLCYTGENEQLAKPTICVGCNSVKKVRAAIRRHLKFNNEMFDLAVVKGAITRSKSQPRRSQGNPAKATAKNPHHHQRPLCGASIGAWREEEHSPAVTFGGIIMIDDDAYGMSVHHLLEEPDDDEDSEDEQEPSGAPQRSMDRHLRQEPASAPAFDSNVVQLIEYTSEDDDDDDDDDDYDEDEEGDLAESDFGIEDDTLELDPSAETYGDTEGISNGEGEEIIITQPALNDVADDFFPCEEDKNEDHIDSHTLGYVHASSGLRRLRRDGVEHEIDWLLMKLDAERLQPYNLIAGGKRYCQQEGLFEFRPVLVDPVCRQHYPVAEDLFPRSIAPSEQLSGLQVHCVGRTSGLGHGRISQTMHLVRFRGRRTFSRAWSVAGNFGSGGDSGAWVVDNELGRICGHVLAWSAGLGIAYVSPMDVMFDDMRKTLQVEKVSLPGANEDMKPVVSGANSVQYPLTEVRALTLEDIRHHKSLVAKHMLHSGNPSRLEREWSARRRGLGQLASG